MKICSVIVCYNPDTKNLLHLCRRLRGSSSAVVLVDNTEKSYISGQHEFSDCVVLQLGTNTGIAHAQNIGINYAINSGAEVVVFFDQDSKIEDDFLSLLLTPLKVGEPGVVVPVFFDDVRDFEFPAMKVNKCGRLTKIYRGDKLTPYEVDVITSSGTAATIATFEIAGLMDEDFFMDFVDTEWSLRCRNKRVPIRVVPSAVMKHSVGEASINFGFMRAFVHSPDRSYYEIRNCFLLFRKQSVPVLLAFMEMMSVFVHHLALFVFLKNRGEYAKKYYSAVIHGIRGVVGKNPV